MHCHAVTPSPRIAHDNLISSLHRPGGGSRFPVSRPVSRQDIPSRSNIASESPDASTARKLDLGSMHLAP